MHVGPKSDKSAPTHPQVGTVEKGQIVVMDKLQVHKSLRVRELIEGAGASVLFLPSY